MDRGYVKLWRKSLDSGLMQNHELWVLWCWCLMKASHKEAKIMVGNQVVKLQPGQFVFGRKKAAKELRVSEKQIRTRMQLLEKLENLAIKRTNKYSIITIVNWETYQPSENGKGQQTGQPRASKGPAKGHKQEVKEFKEQTTLSGFDKFWKACKWGSDKGSKKQALKEWKKCKAERPPLEELLRIVERQIAARRLKLERGEFAPNFQHVERWLKNARWEDEIEDETPRDPIEDLIHCDECGCNSMPRQIVGGKCPACGEVLK